MRKYYLFLIIFFYSFSAAQAQVNTFIAARTGIAFNPSIEINNEIINNSRATNFDLEASLKFIFLKHFFGEVGLAGRVILATGKLGGVSYQSQTLRAMVPLSIGHQISEKWDVAMGLTFQNNLDFEPKISSRANFLWRYNYTLSGRYLFKKKWYFVGRLSHGWRKIPDAFYLNDPKIIVFLGVAKSF